MYYVEVVYRPDDKMAPDGDMGTCDRAIEAVMYPLGGRRSASGYSFWSGQRDMEFTFEDVVPQFNQLVPELERLRVGLMCVRVRCADHETIFLDWHTGDYIPENT